MRSSFALLLATSLVGTGCIAPRWPIEGRLVSPFGLRWQGGPDVHAGVDLEAANGTPVRAMAGGRVRFAGTMGSYGTVVWLDHPGGVLSVYAHLSELRVSPGEPVSKGDVVGLSGRTGNATGPHLHFEIWRSGRPVDPVGVLGGAPRGLTSGP